MTPRSDEMLDFTTFGELSQIIELNWDLCGSIFASVKAVKRVMSNLNTLRGPIAHCSPLAEDEVVRLRLCVTGSD
jgi:membrane-associated protease RseP (regulator of RpoE activity)